MKRSLKTPLLVLAAFLGGAAAAHVADANTPAGNPYAAFDQMSRVLVLVENNYVDPTQRAKIVDGSIKGMVAELDPHSAYMPAAEYALFRGDTQGKFGGVGVEVDFRGEYVTVIAPFDGSPAARAGIKSGDQIVAIDGKGVRGERVDRLVSMMRGPAGTKVKISIRRKDAADLLQFELVREVIHVDSVTGKRLEGEVVYIRIKQFQEGTRDELLSVAGKLRSEKNAKIKGVLVDLRNNPGGLVDEAEGVADEFLPGGTIYTTRHRGRVIDESRATPGGSFSDVPIVVIVNAYSASSAELLAGCLQDNKRAKVVGAQTFGKGSVQTIFDLPGGAGLRLTTMRYYTPSGRSIQAEGIHPDIEVQSPQIDDKGAVRERDLDGHLPAEGPIANGPEKVVTDASKGEAERDAPRAEVPDNPRVGTDFVLATGYEELLKLVAEKK
ncbi:MAG: S41 family peptidase [Polyangiaceae bacterium]|nr:S41 family peptidase [Polyangiaceae bacterium]